jgi:hypothetical protein
MLAGLEPRLPAQYGCLLLPVHMMETNGDECLLTRHALQNLHALDFM